MPQDRREPCAAPTSPVRADDLFGQPRGLTILFLTEMWEVFSFVGMRTLLIYYMTKELGIARHDASFIYGAYTGLAYLGPLAGGAVADRWLSRRQAVLGGGALMCAGQLLLTWPPAFYPALIIVALGVGLFLPSLPSQIAELYADDDPRKGAAYSVYYVGKNLGALLAALICGGIGEWLGWRWGFAAGAVGIALGLVIYVSGGRWLPNQGRAGSRAIAAATPHSGRTLRSRIVILGAVGLSVVLFRSAYEQSGNAVALWLDGGVDRQAGAWTIPMTWFQSLNPALVFLLSPLLIALWTRRGQSGRDSSPVAKMAIGAALLALAFAGLALAAMMSARSGEQTSWVAVAAFFLVLTLAELHILPVGLGLFGRLAPPALIATVIGLWYCTSFVGNLAAGMAGAYAAKLPPEVFFLDMAGVAAVGALILAACIRPARGL
jgi:POT family proton-dependent oligopeptide transporter